MSTVYVIPSNLSSILSPPYTSVHDHTLGNTYALYFSNLSNILYGTFYLIATAFSFIGNLLAIGVWGSYLKNYLTVLYLNLSVCDFIIAVMG